MTLEEALAQLNEANAKISKLETDLTTWKGYSRDHESAKKALEKDFKEKVAQEVATAKAESEKELKTYRAATIASKYKIPENLVSRISGNTVEELEADAKAFALSAGFIKEDGKENTEEAGKGSTFRPVPEQGKGAAPQGTQTTVKTAEEFAALFTTN